MTASRALQAPRSSNQEAHQKQVGVSSDQSNPNSAGRAQRSSSGQNCSPNSSFASATPLSRPGSSTFGTPNSQQQQQQQQRTASSCSSNNDHLGQCRICRKTILANESCHLCSNCNQFICEDCASYSATDKVSVYTYLSPQSELSPGTTMRDSWDLVRAALMTTAD